MHEIGEAIHRAAAGRFPPVDGGWERTCPWREGVEGVVAFTGHSYLAVGEDVPDADLHRLGADGFGGSTGPRLVSALAGSGWIDALDLVLTAFGTGAGSSLVPRPDLQSHERARLAASVRDAVEVLGYAARCDRTVVTLSRGLGGLLEVGVETDPAQRHTGATVLRDVLDRVPEGEIVVAACAPGNARAVRAFLTAGFVPVGSAQLWRPVRDADGRRSRTV